MIIMFMALISGGIVLHSIMIGNNRSVGRAFDLRTLFLTAMHVTSMFIVAWVCGPDSLPAKYNSVGEFLFSATVLWPIYIFGDTLQRGGTNIKFDLPTVYALASTIYTASYLIIFLTTTKFG